MVNRLAVWTDTEKCKFNNVLPFGNCVCFRQMSVHYVFGRRLLDRLNENLTMKT